MVDFQPADSRIGRSAGDLIFEEVFELECARRLPRGGVARDEDKLRVSVRTGGGTDAVRHRGRARLTGIARWIVSTASLCTDG